MLQSWEMSASSVTGAHVAVGLMYRAAKAGSPFQLVLLDRSLLTPDNSDFLEQIHNDSLLRCPVLLLHADDDPLPPGTNASRLGVTESLSDPITQPRLLEAIQSALGAGWLEANDSSATTTTDQPERGESAKILLVEDSRVNQVLAAAILRKHGLEVMIANNGREALDVLASQSFALVLMDVQMPEMDGLEATQRIREREKTTGEHVPIVALTAHALKGDRERCLSAGMDDYLPKPIHAGRLLELISTTLQRTR